MTDEVNHPEHYKGQNGLEAIEVIDAFFADDFYLGNVFKYIARAGKKASSNAMVDLRKAEWYLRRATRTAEEAEQVTREQVARDIEDDRAEVEELRGLRDVCYSDECGEPCRSWTAGLHAELDEAIRERGKLGQKIGELRAEVEELRGLRDVCYSDECGEPCRSWTAAANPTLIVQRMLRDELIDYDRAERIARAVEKAVRAQIAADIEATADRDRDRGADHHTDQWEYGMRTAARIARDGSDR